MTDENDYIKIQEAAVKAAASAYAPYSNFRVGAALLCSGSKIFTGSNVENRSFGLTVCAERSAVSNAVSSGNKKITAAAVFCMDSEVPVPPCGACRQVLSEFCGRDTPVFFAGRDRVFRKLLLKELYPEDSLHDLKIN